MNIDSLSITLNSFQNTRLNVVQPSNNQIVANTRKIKNAAFAKFNFKSLPPEVVMDHIVKHLKPSDIKNLNKSNIYQQIPVYHNYLTNSNYRNVVNEWLAWQNTPLTEEGGNRKLAVEKMVECLENNGEHLDLSYLHLINLPNLKPLKSVQVLNYVGNDPQPIYDCFSSPVCHFYELQSLSNLPLSIKKIHIDDDTGSIFTRSLARRLGGHCFFNSYFERSCNNKFGIFGDVDKYTDDFDKDFMKSYRL